METVLSCPLGSACEEAKDGKLHRCRWYVEVGTLDEDTGMMVNQYRECAISIQVLLLTELKRQSKGVQQAVDSRGNEQILRQDAFLELARESKRLSNGGN